MSKQNLNKETLKSRSQITIYEKTVESVQVDSLVLSRLISLGSANSESASFAKLYGFLDTQKKVLNVRDCVALPCLGEDETRKLDKLEKEEKNIRVNLGFNYQCVGTFIVSPDEDSFGESICFFLSHFNVYEGFSLLMVYSAETALSSNDSPIKAFLLSEELSRAYKYKIDKELFEPSPAELSDMIKNDSPFLKRIPVKAHISAVLDLITSHHRHPLRVNNPLPFETSDPVSHLENGLTQTVHQMLNVLHSQRSLEMRRQYLLNFGGALERMKTLLTLKRDKLERDGQRLKDLESLANPSDKTN